MKNRSKLISFDNIVSLKISKTGHVNFKMKNGDEFKVSEAIELFTWRKSIHMTLQKANINRLDSQIEWPYKDFEPFFLAYQATKTKKNKEAIGRFLVEIWNNQIINLKRGEFNVSNPLVKNYKPSKKEVKVNSNLKVQIGKKEFNFSDFIK